MLGAQISLCSQICRQYCILRKLQMTEQNTNRNQPPQKGVQLGPPYVSVCFGVFLCVFVCFVYPNPFESGLNPFESELFQMGKGLIKMGDSLGFGQNFKRVGPNFKRLGPILWGFLIFYIYYIYIYIYQPRNSRLIINFQRFS